METTDLQNKIDGIMLNSNCHLSKSNECTQKTYLNKSKLINKPTVFAYGLYGYILTRQGATKLLKQAFPIVYPIDHLVKKMHEEGNMLFARTNEPYVEHKDWYDSATQNIDKVNISHNEYN